MDTNREQAAPEPTRAPFGQDALIRHLVADGDGDWSPCRLVDLSPDGAAVETRGDLGPGARVLLRLLTSDGVTPAYQLCGTVARAGEAGLRLIGIEFDRMPGAQHDDLDAFARHTAHTTGPVAGAA